MVASPRAARAAAILGQAISSGKLSIADLALFADTFKAAGWTVRIPLERGALVTTRVKCGKPTCECARKGGRKHGPYAFRHYRDPWGRRMKEYLGRVRSPGAAPKPTFGHRSPKPGALPGGFLVE